MERKVYLAGERIPPWGRWTYMSNGKVTTIIGCGGAGVNFVVRSGPKCEGWAKVYAVEADAKHLVLSRAKNSLLMGPKTLHGMGSRMDYTVAEMGAKESRLDFLKMVHGSKTVFVVLGLAGTSGTAGAVLLSRLAKEAGARAIVLGILPFSEEGSTAELNSRRGLAKLRSACDTVVVVKNDQLLGIHPKVDLGEALKLMDGVLVEEAKRILQSPDHEAGAKGNNVVFLDIGVSRANGSYSTSGRQ